MGMQERIRELYDGGTRAARSFRWFLIAFDIATIAYFLATATEELTPTVLAVDMVVGVLILSLIDNILNLADLVSPYLNGAIQGIIIVLAVVLQRDRTAAEPR